MSLRCQVECAHGSRCWRIGGHGDGLHLTDDGCCASEDDVVRWAESLENGDLVLDVQQWPDSAGLVRIEPSVDECRSMVESALTAWPKPCCGRRADEPCLYSCKI